MTKRKFIPISKPDIGKEEIRAVQEVLRSGSLAQGARVERFEKGFARLCGSKHAIAVGNGTQALTLSLMAMDPPLAYLERGHRKNEVITTPFTFIATANAILAAGGVPVFVDIEPETFNMDPGLVKRAITGKTRAILPVHLYGQPTDMAPIVKLARKHRLAIIEDACQAHGATYDGKKAGNLVGNLKSSCGTFSFYPTKNMTTGEGGMITTNDGKLAHRLRHLRNHGMPQEAGRRYEYLGPGFNTRMTEMAAAIGLGQLKRIVQNNKKRNGNAREYNRLLKDVPGVMTPHIRKRPKTTHVFHQYTIRIRPEDRKKCSIEERKGLMRALEKEGVMARIYYPSSLASVTHLGDAGRVVGKMRNTDQAVNEVLSLPVGPHVSKKDIGRIVRVIRKSLS